MSRKVLGAVVLALVTLAPATALPQSLAETARKEQARRKQASPAATPKVYTESDLPASPARPVSESDAAGEAEKARVRSSAEKSSAARDSSEASRQREIAAFKARAAEIQARIARAEALVQQLGNHPTGGGKVCRLPEGVFRPGETAPEQVVCPYQMESRYDVAKRNLGRLREELVALQNEALRLGIAF
ncbi:MAG: hypothetical protein K1Y01_16085 [Vicinamibacteria bacterium]|nr:hypothetical protein [Vicinamibacteria bacterium]